MPTDVLLVKAGMTMTEGTVADWHVADGGEVAVGELLYRMETEKIELEVEAEAAGIVRHLVAAGSKVEPGTLVAQIFAPGEAQPTMSDAGQHGSLEAVASRPLASPIARRLAREAGLQFSSLKGTGPGGRVVEADVLAAKSALADRSPRPPTIQGSRTTPGAPGASPLARRLASERGIDIGAIHGTGPGRRVTREDVELAAASQSVISPPGPGKNGLPPEAPSTGRRIPVRGMRRIIAERMVSSLKEMAQLSMAMDVAMDEAVKLRTSLVAEWASEDVRPSYTDLVIRAVGKALRQHPGLNATFGATEIELLDEVNIGLAVALDGGLVVPVIRTADRLSLKEIAVQSKELAAAARAGSLSLDDMAGGTFSVTALGAAGIDFFTPVVNPPNVAILGIGRIRDGVAWDGDRPVRRQVLTLSLTIDHRAVDGAPGASFVNTVRELLESPYRLLI